VIGPSASRRSARQSTAGSPLRGNLQKFVVGREILQEAGSARSQPADVGVGRRAPRAAIRQAIVDLAGRGCACWSSRKDLDELLELCDSLVGDQSGRLRVLMILLFAG